MLEGRLVLFLDGMDEVPTGLKSQVEAYIMCFLRTSARVVMTSRPGGFSQAWLSQCTTMRILPLDPTMQESVAKARLRHGAHLRMFSSLMGRPDLQLLASNPLILSMVLAYIRGAAHNSTDGGTPTLNRWRLYHSAMSTIITRLDAKTLEARKGRRGATPRVHADAARTRLRRLTTALPAQVHADAPGNCVQGALQADEGLERRGLRLAITEQTSALWEDVKESVARGQFAVLTFFIENDETIYRFGQLTFQEHLCSMVVNRMLATEMDRVKAIMTASGGLKKMLQGSWWLTVTQFCIEGLMVEGAQGEALAARFAETMLDEVVDKDGVVKLTAKEIHSFDSMSAFAALLKHNHRVTALELGDAKTEINAEWLSQLCPALAGHHLAASRCDGW